MVAPQLDILSKSCKDTLLKLAKMLNANQIKWALGGSMLLAFYGLAKVVNDIDILVDELDGERIKALLNRSDVITRIPHPKTGCESKFFLPIIMDNVEVDIIGGFTIQNQTFPLKASDIEEVVVDDVAIYLHSLAMWKMFYSLMERSEKSNRIESYLSHK
ncbi:MAG: hypothetical protein JXL85_09990 [Bacilli bacterium]|nr:hypothetical protein [Bacilli bacterium]